MYLKVFILLKQLTIFMEDAKFIFKLESMECRKNNRREFWWRGSYFST
jgi:hypothetical protein